MSYLTGYARIGRKFTPFYYGSAGMWNAQLPISYVSLVRLPTGRAHGYAIMKMCEEFAAHGADVTLMVPRRSHNMSDDPFSYYGIKRAFALERLWATDFLGTSANARLAFALDQFTFLISLWRRRLNTSLVYTRDYQVALCVRSRHIVLEIHSIPERTFLFSRAIARARNLVVISEGLKRSLIAIGVPPAKILVAPDAVDLSEFEIATSRGIWETYGIDPAKKIALYTGHFYGWKGADTFAESASFLPDGIEIVIMGGVDRELAEFKKKYESPRVHVIGYQPRERIPSFLMAADVLILPNSAKPKISSQYTSPLKLFQYMAAGVPTVASDLPSIREILTDESAFWFAPDDARALAHQIEYVLAHPIEAREKAARARADVGKYTWDARARAILDHIAIH